MSKRPIGKICPSCSGTEYSSCKPEGLVAFTSDRKCKGCGTRYKMPTPAWAAIVFLVIGTPMLLGGLGAFGLLLSHPNPTPCGYASFACIATVGGIAVWHGLQAIIRPGKV